MPSHGLPPPCAESFMAHSSGPAWLGGGEGLFPGPALVHRLRGLSLRADPLGNLAPSAFPAPEAGIQPTSSSAPRRPCVCLLWLL